MSARETTPQDIVIEEVLPHAPETVWKTITTGALIDRWLMRSEGFEPVAGKRFTLHTTPAGPWDGVIHCEILEVVPGERLSYSWRGGHDDNVGYGSYIDTVVTLTLTRVDTGTKLRVVHAGFVLPKNASTVRTLGAGWKTVVGRISATCETQAN